jgi:hypothetical protein
VLDLDDEEVLHYLTGKKFYDDEDVERARALSNTVEEGEDDEPYDIEPARSIPPEYLDEISDDEPVVDYDDEPVDDFEEELN